MSLSAILDTVIGLSFVFFLVSLFCAALNEAFAQWLGRRGEFLREGLVNLVADRWIYLRLINHPLISSLYRDVPGKPATPSYVPSQSFAYALIDVVSQKAAQLDPTPAPAGGGSKGFEDLRKAAAVCRDHGYTVGQTLLTLLDMSDGSIERARGLIEGWFESGTQRVSGWYKARTRKLLFFIGLAVAVLFNVDTVLLTTTIAGNARLRRMLADEASGVVASGKIAGLDVEQVAGAERLTDAQAHQIATKLRQLEAEGLPLGFSCLGPKTSGTGDAAVAAAGDGFFTYLQRAPRDCLQAALATPPGIWPRKLLGWLITALAVSFGAPFWFDLLNKFVDLRGAGKKPPPPAEPTVPTVVAAVQKS